MTQNNGTAVLRKYPDVQVTYRLGKDAMGENVTVTHKDGSKVTMSRAEFEAEFKAQ